MSNLVAPSASHRSASTHQAGPSLYAADGGRKYLNHAERLRVIAACAKLNPRKALFALTLAWTGARVSEVLAVTPASFQLERGVVAFVTLKRRRHVVREVPIPPALVAALEKQFDLAARQLDPEQALVRLWRWHRVTAWRTVRALMLQSRVIGRPACPRGLRHGFGVEALQAGVPLNLLQRWLGHARMSTTAIYADASGPEERAFAKRLWRAKD